MSEIEIRFTPENAGLVLRGRKMETVRRERHGRIGDTFWVRTEYDGCRCAITSITPMTVRAAALSHFHPLGFDTPEQVVAELGRVYPGGLDLDRIVYVHGFIRVL